MKGVRVKKRANQEDLDSELFQVVQRTARRFVSDIEKLGRRYHCCLGVTTDPVWLRSRVENGLMSLVGGNTSATRRRRNHRFSSKRVSAAGWKDWPELSGDELGLKTVRDDPDPAVVTGRPSFWRRIFRHAIYH